MPTTYTARFVPQAWVNDYAVDVDPEGDTEWDCTEAVREYLNPHGGLRKTFRLMTGGEYLDNDDILHSDPAAPEWVREWRGPFSIYVSKNGDS